MPRGRMDALRIAIPSCALCKDLHLALPYT
ncbi:hypothetical protein CO2235_MP10455 [Cupriavidus oxalaticus]|uniref:Uncharacterized protein n=1 Tax=Cupriavidus oxalaticus TaxID=96344 RepID=A0A375GHS7_9BURK|nr:hypothetical protein CO2235_MP10455 [Cupriavidus oxalaticus]